VIQQRRKELLIQLAVETVEQLQTIVVPEKKTQKEDGGSVDRRY
jgi:hypothetical protein